MEEVVYFTFCERGVSTIVTSNHRERASDAFGVDADIVVVDDGNCALGLLDDGSDHNGTSISPTSRWVVVIGYETWDENFFLR